MALSDHQKKVRANDRLQKALTTLRVRGRLRVDKRDTFLDIGESVRLRWIVNGVAFDITELYPDGARALGEALIELADTCKPNGKQIYITKAMYLAQEEE